MSEPYTAELVGIRLKSVRIWRGWRQDAIVNIVGNIVRSQVSQWERGVQRMPFRAAVAIKAVTGVTLDFLYAGDMSSLKPETADELLPILQELCSESGVALREVIAG